MTRSTTTLVLESLDEMSLEDLLHRDLSADPPEGMPRLTALQQAYVKRRAGHQLEPVEETLRQIGAGARSSPHRSTKVAAYMTLISRLSTPEDEDPSSLRRLAITRLARVVRRGEDRERVMAAKVLKEFLPPAPAQRAPELADLTDLEVDQALEDALLAVQTTSEALEIALSRDDGGVYRMAPVPGKGTVAPTPLPELEDGPAQEDGGAIEDGRADPKPENPRDISPW